MVQRTLLTSQRKVDMEVYIDLRNEDSLAESTLKDVAENVDGVLLNEHQFEALEEGESKFGRVLVQAQEMFEGGVTQFYAYSPGRESSGRVDAVEVIVSDFNSLEVANKYASQNITTMVKFADHTKIPLEIVLAHADESPGQVFCHVTDETDGAITRHVLEKGPAGIIVPAASHSYVRRYRPEKQSSLELTTFTVQELSVTGAGERACIDTCSTFDGDEGILVGSFAHGLFLCSSETHPLPYMDTRPFRVNAGAVHSYVYLPDGRTKYISELSAGDVVAAVNQHGRLREVVVGRVKIETRPILTIHATDDEGRRCSIAMQNDWHVRVLGPNGAVQNITELKAGDEILALSLNAARHTGLAIDEYILEK